MADPIFNVSNDDIISVLLQGRQDAQKTLTILHYRAVGLTAPTPGWELFADVMDALQPSGAVEIIPAYRACCVDTWSIEMVQIQKVHPTRYLYRRFTFSPPEAGTVSSAALPPAVSVSLTKRVEVALTGRVNGRIQMPAVPAEFVNAGVLEPTGFTAYLALAAVCELPIPVPSGGELRPIVLKRTVPAGSQEWVDTVIQLNARSQRTRVVGRGI